MARDFLKTKYCFSWVDSVTFQCQPVCGATGIQQHKVYSSTIICSLIWTPLSASTKFSFLHWIFLSFAPLILLFSHNAPVYIRSLWLHPSLMIGKGYQDSAAVWSARVLLDTLDEDCVCVYVSMNGHFMDRLKSTSWSWIRFHSAPPWTCHLTSFSSAK